MNIEWLRQQRREQCLHESNEVIDLRCCERAWNAVRHTATKSIVTLFLRDQSPIEQVEVFDQLYN